MKGSSTERKRLIEVLATLGISTNDTGSEAHVHLRTRQAADVGMVIPYDLAYRVALAVLGAKGVADIQRERQRLPLKYAPAVHAKPIVLPAAEAPAQILLGLVFRSEEGGEFELPVPLNLSPDDCRELAADLISAADQLAASPKAH